MKLTELLAEIGDENLQYQNLDEALIKADYKKGSGTKVTFGTENICHPDGFVKLGLVVWLDRAKVNSILNKS